MRTTQAENAYLIREMKRSALMLRDNMVKTGKMTMIRHGKEM
jgi:hypothetical protein